MGTTTNKKELHMNKISLRQHIRIILAITGKDILDAIKNKTTISVLISALFAFFFYMLLPTLEQDDIIRLYDAGGSAWLTALEDSQPFRISVYNTQEAMLDRISLSGERELGLVLPADYDQVVANGGLVELQGYLLNWVSEKRTSEMITQAEEQLAGVVGTPVNITVERLFMLPTSTGTGLSRAVGCLLLIIMCGMVLVPNLMFEEKRARTLEALLVSPASAGQITMGKALTGLFFCLLGFGLACLFNASLIRQWGLTLLAGLCAAFFTVSLGLLLGAMVENRQQFMVMANLTIFPLLIAIFISVETELLPVWLVTIARWLPTTAAFDLLRASFTPQTGFDFIAPRIAVILLFVIGLLGFVAWKIMRSDRM
jgi:ABC-type transport system involved in multi-copper enzyme maturation permease subunit